MSPDPHPAGKFVTRTWRFGSGGSGTALLGDGWWNPEKWGVWSSRTEASLTAPYLVEKSDDVHLRIEYKLPPRWKGRRRGQVFVRVNGEETYGGVDDPVAKVRAVDVRVTGGLWRRFDPAVVTVQTDTLQNPAESIASDDHRDLGFGLISITAQTIAVPESDDGQALSAPPEDVKQALDALSENIRLVVWDLDDTFWRGTLMEGGAQFVIGNKAIVKALAARGILLSICSKNNVEDVLATLEPTGLLDYFVFPQIDWQPKGPRLAKLVELVQLRPPTILFIDDIAQPKRGETFCP